MGLDTEPLDPKAVSQLAQYPPSEIQFATDLLNQISKTFETAQRSSERFKRKTTIKGDLEKRIALDVDTELDKFEPRFKILHRSSQKIVRQYQKAATFKRSAKDRVVWTLYERSHLDQLVRTISDLVADLEELFPATCNLQKELCRDEVSEIDSKSLPLLLDAVRDDDQLC